MSLDLGDGDVTVDRFRWGSAIFSKCDVKYNDSRGTEEVQHDRIFVVLEAECAPEDAPIMTYYHAMKGRARLSSRRANGGSLPVVAEMLKSLPMCVAMLVFCAFSELYMDPLSVLPSSWRFLAMFFLRKCSFPTTW